MLSGLATELVGPLPGTIGLISACRFRRPDEDESCPLLRGGIGATIRAGFAGPGAIATGVAAEPVDPAFERGDSESRAKFLADVILVPEAAIAEGAISEFFREAFLDPLAAADGAAELEPRLRFLMISVLRDNGRTTPCNFKKSPHALQSGLPSALRRHSGVVWV